MFGAYSERMDKRAKRQLAASLAISIVLYGGGVTAVALAANAVSADGKKKDKQVEVTFYKAVPEPPPPPPAPEPPPPPPPEPLPPPPPETPPPPPPPKARKGAKPPPKAPKKMPDKPAAEADPSQEKPKDETPTSDLPNQWGDPNGKSEDEGKVYGDPNGKDEGTGPVAPPAPPPPVILPAGATRPEVIGSLVTDTDYPRAALSARIEGTVIVKVAVQVDGTVKLVKFLKRDPNFDDAVLDILKRLRFKPAVYNGRPIAVYQNLKFPFTLQ